MVSAHSSTDWSLKKIINRVHTYSSRNTVFTMVKHYIFKKNKVLEDSISAHSPTLQPPPPHAPYTSVLAAYNLTHKTTSHLQAPHPEKIY